MMCLPHQPFTTWVVVHIVQLLSPEGLRVNRLRMHTAPPKPALAILPRSKLAQ
jgi:hypothetical protein